MDNSKNALFFKEEAFPIILKRILSDDQPEKIKIMFNGFEYIIDNKILNLENILTFYDVLAEIRLNDFVYLTKYYIKPMRMFEGTDEIKLKLNLNLKIDKHNDEEQVDLGQYISNKLFRLGILEYAKERVDTGYQRREYVESMPYKWQYTQPQYETNLNKYQISNFGKSFIKFFYEQDEDREK